MGATQTLFEREQDLDSLTESLVGLGPSGGKVVLVRGEAGIGKSRLVDEFIATRASDSHILKGWCDDLATPRPMGPFWDLSRSEPALQESLATADRSGLLEAVMDLLSRRLRPTVLVIEDTHWADEATLDVIQYIGRRIEQTNGLLLLTYRDGEVDPDHRLRGVIGGLRPASVLRIRLGGLSRLAVAEMLDGSGLDIEEVFSATDGNPFLVTEIAATSGEGVPESVQASVMARVGKLSPKAQALLRILSVVPERISRIEVSQYVGGADASLGEAERRGLLVAGDDSVAFHHELIRRAVEASLTMSERADLNKDVLAALPSDTDPARLVHHARQANDIAALVDLAPKAAASALALGSRCEARDYFRLLEGHLDRVDPAMKGSILDQWAEEERGQGDYDEAIRMNGLAILHYRSSGDRRAESAALVDAAFYHVRNGQPSSAERFARESIEVLGPNANRNDLANALEVNGYLAMNAADYDRALELVTRTLEVAGADVDERIVIRSLNHRGVALSSLNYPDGRDSLEEALRRAEAAGDSWEASRALVNQAFASFEARDLQVAWDYLERADIPPIGNEAASAEPHITAVRVRILELQGLWSQVDDLPRDELEFMHLSKVLAAPAYGIIEARRNRATAQTSLSQVWEMASATGAYEGMASAAAVLAEHAWISGGTDIPVFDFKKIMETGLDMGQTWRPGSIALWLWKLGELTDAPIGIAEPYRLTIEGETSAAAEQWTEMGCPYERAIALSHGDQSAQLEALEELENLGATAVADKFMQQMRDQGVSVPRRRNRKTIDHPIGLTARQAEVLALLAEQLSNNDIADQLFLSPRTVERHVAAVMRKLDALSRDEAVEKAADRGLLVPPIG